MLIRPCSIAVKSYMKLYVGDLCGTFVTKAKKVQIAGSNPARGFCIIIFYFIKNANQKRSQAFIMPKVQCMDQLYAYLWLASICVDKKVWLEYYILQ